MNLASIQRALKEADLDGWLFCDFHNRDHLAYRILKLDLDEMTSRRWFYYIPAQGEPVKLCHSVEPTRLDALPGQKRLYLPWEQLHKELGDILGSPKKIAMQYSKNNNIPYIATIDAGTIELIRHLGHDVRSSADLVQLFESRIDEAGFRSHVEAGEIVQTIKNEAFEKIGKAVRTNQPVTEFEVKEFIKRRFEEEGLTNRGDHPIVGVNEHPTNPHFKPTRENSRVIQKGDMVLIDLWAKKKDPGSIYYDITWCGYVGNNPPGKYVKVFSVVCSARDAAIDLVRERMSKSSFECYGWEVDDACRNVIQEAGYGGNFIHRTGHSIGEEVHGNGVNIDNLETKDERKLISGICFSIEPGIYIPGQMAVRTEVNVFITLQNEVVIAGDIQKELILI